MTDAGSGISTGFWSILPAGRLIETGKWPRSW
jgi:hypothetical protein